MGDIRHVFSLGGHVTFCFSQTSFVHTCAPEYTHTCPLIHTLILNPNSLDANGILFIYLAVPFIAAACWIFSL